MNDGRRLERQNARHIPTPHITTVFMTDMNDTIIMNARAFQQLDKSDRKLCCIAERESKRYGMDRPMLKEIWDNEVPL